MRKPQNEAEDAGRVVTIVNILHMAREDQIRFAEAMVHPPKPVEQLARAAKRHAELIEKR